MQTSLGEYWNWLKSTRGGREFSEEKHRHFNNNGHWDSAQKCMQWRYFDLICSTAAEAGLIVQVFVRARDEMGQQRAVIAVYHESNIGLWTAAALMRKDVSYYPHGRHITEDTKLLSRIWICTGFFKGLFRIFSWKLKFKRSFTYTSNHPH